MANPIDLTQQALDSLADAGLGSESPAEAYVIGWQDGWRRALDLAIQIEQRINTKEETE